MSSTRLCGVYVLCALTLSAQSADWNNVKSIPPGAEVRVAISGRGETRGTLQSFTADSVVFNSGSGQETLRRADVTRVSVKKESHRKRHTLIGLAAGGGGGVAIGLASRCSGFCFISKGELVAATTVVGVLVGTIIGVLIPTGGWHEVYKP